MTDQDRQMGFLSRVLVGFIAGFWATLVFHQLMVAFLRGVGVVPFLPYSWTPTEPFGIPAVLSLAFWGGVWGIIFMLIDGRFPPGAGYWAVAFLFGAVLPSLVALTWSCRSRDDPWAEAGTCLCSWPRSLPMVPGVSAPGSSSRHYERDDVARSRTIGAAFR